MSLVAIGSFVMLLAKVINLWTIMISPPLVVRHKVCRHVRVSIVLLYIIFVCWELCIYISCGFSSREFCFMYE